MYISSITVKIELSLSAQGAFDKFFGFVKTVECKKGTIFMHENMVAVQFYNTAPNPEDAIKVLTDFVSHLKELTNVFEKEALS